MLWEAPSLSTLSSGHLEDTIWNCQLVLWPRISEERRMINCWLVHGSPYLVTDITVRLKEQNASIVVSYQRWICLTIMLNERKWKLVTQSYLILCDHMDCSLPGSSVRGFLQAIVLEWILISSQVVVQSLSHVLLFATPWTAARQASLSFTISGVCSNSCALSQWCHPTISSCPTLLFLPSIFPSTMVFSNELVLCIRWPR